MNTARTRLALDPHRSGDPTKLFRIVATALLLGVFAVIGYSLYGAAHRLTVDEAYVRGIVIDCNADGYQAHIHRDAHGKILGASCDRPEAKP